MAGLTVKALVSLSFSVAATVPIATLLPLYLESLLLDACAIVAVPFSPSWSSAADTVTDCAVLQFCVVNVRSLFAFAVLTVRSESGVGVLAIDGVTVTAAVGAVLSATV